MSRLLCIATRGIIPHLAMGGFKKLSRLGRNRSNAGKGYRDGWGIGYFSMDIARIQTRLGDAFTSVRWDELTHMTCSNPDVKILLASLRNKGAKNAEELDNRLSPFCLKDGAGKDWLLCFDGDIGPHKVSGASYTPHTDIPQMKLLKRIIELVQETANKVEGKRASMALGEAIAEIVQHHHYDVLNMALSDGHDIYLVRYVEKEEDWNKLYYCKTGTAIIGCSEPLAPIDGQWEEIPNRSMIAFDTHLNVHKVQF
jgi:predicted glutamine amidotransferase